MKINIYFFIFFGFSSLIKYSCTIRKDFLRVVFEKKFTFFKLAIFYFYDIWCMFMIFRTKPRIKRNPGVSKNDFFVCNKNN